MDKRGLKILFGCMACTMLVVILFLVALQFARPPCELILVTEPEKLGPVLEQRARAIRSRDKFITVKMSAYLEYVVDDSSSSVVQQQQQQPFAAALSAPHPATVAPTSPGPAQQSNPSNGQTLPAAPVAGSLNQSLGATTPQAANAGNSLHQLQAQPPSGAATVASVFGNGSSLARPLNNTAPSPSQVPTGLSAAPSVQQPQPPAPARGGPHPSEPTGLAVSGESGPAPSGGGGDKRFLPLELEGVISSKKEHNYRITLNFNCTTMALRLRREQLANRSTRAYIDQISLELRVPGRQGKTTCQLAVPSTGTFIAHDTDKSPHCFYRLQDATSRGRAPLTFSCINPDTKQALADLHVLHFEYELDNRSKREASFSSLGHACLIP